MKPYIAIEMPLDRNGEGPCDRRHAAKIAYEVWDVNCKVVGVHLTMEDAQREADALNQKYVELKQ